MTSSSPPMNAQSPALKTYIKTPEGRYKLESEMTHPAGLLQYSQSKAVSQLTVACLKEKSVACLKEKSVAQTQPHPTPTSISGSSMRTVASRLLGGAGNGARTVGFSGGNGSNRAGYGGGRIGVSDATAMGSSSYSCSNFDGKGTYLLFNVGDTLFIGDLNSQEKHPIKSVHFGNSNPVCHAFDAKAKDGHDLLIGMQNGDIYSVSLRQQLQDAGKKLVGVQHYNKDGVITSSRCTCVSWVPDGDGAFVVGHADGSIFVYEKAKDAAADCSFPLIKDQTLFTVAHARSSKSNPIARWHICQGSINNMSFSMDGHYLAIVGRDGFLRVFDYANEQLICGGKSYYGALLCCAWSPDGKYILTGGEDDLVQVWSMDEQKLVAWGEGHNSWVSGVAFDSYWSAPDSHEIGENLVYRFGSVGQDTQLLLWDLAMDEIALPLRCPTGGSPTLSSGSHSAHWDNICPLGTLQPSPSMRDVPKLSPVVAHRVHVEPLSGLIFTSELLLTTCREGHIKVWSRPEKCDEDLSSTCENLGGTVSFMDRHVLTSTGSGDSGSKHLPPILLE